MPNALLPRGFAISYVGPLLAILVGILHASIAPVIVIAGVKPNLVLVAVVLVTVLAGFLPGITWAFAAGLTANLLVGDPLGSVPFAMLLVAVVVLAGSRAFGRAVWIYPVAAAFAGSILFDAISLATAALVSEASLGPPPADVIVPAAMLNAALTALILYPARSVVERYATEEAAAW